VDLGFRVGSLASARKFALSADVAFTLEVHQDWTNLHNREEGPTLAPQMNFGGFETLKGVSFAYPAFWIDVAEDDALTRAMDRVTQPARIDAGNVSALVTELYRHHKIPHVWLPGLLSREIQATRIAMEAVKSDLLLEATTELKEPVHTAATADEDGDSVLRKLDDLLDVTNPAPKD
jgi:hypothetical protein